jgi:hypothetical protein
MASVNQFSNTSQPAKRSPFRCFRTYVAGVLVLLILAAVYGVMQAREAGRRTSCHCRLQNLAMACMAYRTQYGVFPPAYTADRQGRPMHSWRVLLLPYLDQQELYEKYDFAEPWYGPQNIKLLDEMPSIYACPSHTPRAQNSAVVLPFASIIACGSAVPSGGVRNKCTSYAAVLGPRCAFRGADPVAEADIIDGMGQTLLLGEVTDANILWTKPEDVDVAKHPQLGDRMGFSSEHAGIVSFAFADGRVRCISVNTPQKVINALYTGNGREPIRDDEY